MDEQCSALLEMPNVMKCCHSCPVSVWLDWLALHLCLVYLPPLFRSPVQHTKTQCCSLLSMGNVEDWLVSVDWRVHCVLITRFFSGNHWSDRFLYRVSLSPFVRIIIVIIIISAMLAWLSATSTPSSSTNTTTGSTSAIVVT